jgi:hypothetical protein
LGGDLVGNPSATAAANAGNSGEFSGLNADAMAGKAGGLDVELT